MIPLHLTHYARKPVPPTCDYGHRRAFMLRDGTNVLRDEFGAVISAGPRFRCPVCRGRVYREVYP